ncbi:MAG: MBL fold metallo-hydrolase [Oscillospiraceae bacterium]
MKNIYCIEVPLPKNPLRVLNSYVIKGDGHNLLIDTGFKHEECRQALISGLDELNINMAETDIILTHLHSDHTGLAPEIVVPGRKVYISRAEIPWMFGETRRAMWKMDDMKIRRSGFALEVIESSLHNAPSRGMAASMDFEDYTPIDNGDEFSCGGYTLKAVLTPGHTPAHMCFWMEEQKTMFTGDHVLFDISPNITNWNLVEDSLGDYLRSLQAIDKYDVQIALPSHRKTGDFHARIAVLLEHHEKRLDECLKVVAENPNSSVYDIAGKLTWKIRCSSWEDFPISQKWFAVGECHAHLRHLEMLGKVKADDSEEIVRFNLA